MRVALFKHRDYFSNFQFIGDCTCRQRKVKYKNQRVYNMKYDFFFNKLVLRLSNPAELLLCNKLVVSMTSCSVMGLKKIELLIKSVRYSVYLQSVGELVIGLVIRLKTVYKVLIKFSRYMLWITNIFRPITKIIRKRISRLIE